MIGGAKGWKVRGVDQAGEREEKQEQRETGTEMKSEVNLQKVRNWDKTFAILDWLCYYCIDILNLCFKY